MQELECDVLVVGAGPTGLILSNFLGLFGVETVLIERNASTVGEPRAVSIDDESMRTMQALGLIEDVLRIVSRGYGSIYLSPSGRPFFTVKPTSKDYGFDKRNAFQQPELEALLLSKLDRFDCVSGLFLHELLNFEQDDRCVTATVQSGSVKKIIRARYMAACDGGRSRVRNLLNISLTGSTFQERWLILDIHQTLNRCRDTQVHCDPARASIALPGPGGVRRYEFLLREGEQEAADSDQNFARELLARVGPDREASIRRQRVYTFHARVAERWREGRVFLAGDAAHLTPPFAGQGMNSGVRDAHNLAWKLNAALSNNDYPAILDSYETERRPHVQSMIDLALTMGSVMAPKSGMQGIMTRLFFDTLSLVPPARDYLAQMRYKPDPRFEKGWIWEDAMSHRSTMVGRLFPQPQLEDINRHRILLDDCLGLKPYLIIFSEAPDAAMDLSTQRILEGKGIGLLGITPEWVNPAASGLPSFRDASGHLGGKRFRHYQEHFFLLRPDRYVAAAARIGRLYELNEAIEACGATCRTRNSLEQVPVANAIDCVSP